MKLIACYLMGNAEHFVDLTLNSVAHTVDSIIIIYDTSSKDKTKEKLNGWKSKLGDKLVILEREYEHNYNVKNANSNARNFYLDYLKENHLGDYCLVLDADEAPDDNIIGLKGFVESLDNNKEYIFSIKMIHFISNLGNEDASQADHYVPHRLFKINKDLYYPAGEHPVLTTENKHTLFGRIDILRIYHLAYCREMFYIKDRYLNHLNKSEIHSADFLKEWYHAHLLGFYPTRRLSVISLPEVIKKEFMIDEQWLKEKYSKKEKE